MLTSATHITRACGCEYGVTLMAPTKTKMDAARAGLEQSYCRPCGDGFRRGRKKATWGGGLSPNSVREAKEHLRAGKTIDETSLLTGISRTMMGHIKRGERWAQV